MPILKYGGQSYQIPFNANKIAELISQGHTIQPDPDIDEATLKAHQSLIRRLLENRQSNQQPGTQTKTNPSPIEVGGKTVVLPKLQQANNTYQPTGLLSSPLWKKLT